MNLRRAAIAAVVLFATGCDRHERRRVLPGATSYPVQGIDVSRHQGTIDWQAVAGSGIRFAWIKATEGGDYLDPQFRRNWALSRAAGVRPGAYHFMYWCRPAADQAAWFISNVPADAVALPPVLDVEWNPQSRTCPNKPPPEVASAAMQAMLDAMEKAYGRLPVIYAPLDFYREVMQGRFMRYPLWLRGLALDPSPDYDDRRWVVWQYSETGAVAGIGGDVDLDAFAGDEATLAAWAGRGSAAPER